MLLKNFVVFEGIDGAGTSTQLNLLKNDSDFADVLFTAEPTSTQTGIFLRSMLKGDIKISNETACYVFAADRNEHVNGEFLAEGKNLITGIKTACANGRVVISDRYIFSSLAYQSINCEPKISEAVNQFFPLPEILFYFDISPKISLQRITGRETKEIYEKEDFLNKTVEQYERIIKMYSAPEKNEGMKIVGIDATKSKEEIFCIIKNELLALKK